MNHELTLLWVSRKPLRRFSRITGRSSSRKLCSLSPYISFGLRPVCCRGRGGYCGPRPAVGAGPRPRRPPRSRSVGRAVGQTARRPRAGTAAVDPAGTGSWTGRGGGGGGGGCSRSAASGSVISEPPISACYRLGRWPAFSCDGDTYPEEHGKPDRCGRLRPRGRL